MRLGHFRTAAARELAKTIQVGSIGYRAPEVELSVGSTRYSSKVDIWSLGVVVFELLHGYRPVLDDKARTVLRS